MKLFFKVTTIALLYLLVSLSPAFAGGWNSFKTVTYTGTGSDREVSGVGFRPDMTWVKNRTSTTNHFLVDSIRGPSMRIHTNVADAEADIGGAGVTNFTDHGYRLGSAAGLNELGSEYVAWSWKAGDTEVYDDSGSIPVTRKSNPDSGFAVVTYTGNNLSNQSLAHGLGKTPKFILIKSLDAVEDWIVFHSDLTNSNYCLKLNTTNAEINSSYQFGADPTDTAFTISTGLTNNAGNRYIAYVWTDIPGYSAMGSYTGNGLADGPSIDLGFQPDFLLTKRTDVADHWVIKDSTRDTSNPRNSALYPAINGAEAPDVATDFTDTGFTIKTSAVRANANGGKYIYMAFAEKEAPQISFTADQTSVVYDPAGVTGEVNLSWNVTNAGANPDISISPLNHANTDAIGSISDKPKAPTTYTLMVTYEGETFSQDLFVDVTGGFQQGGTTTFTGPVGIGKLNPTEALEVNGTIKAKEILVTMDGWADYVFKPGYKLQDLNSVKSYIRKNGHLPGIPSGDRIVKNGLSVSRMFTLQMQKIEELTLHLIRLSQENEALRQEVRQLKNIK